MPFVTVYLPFRKHFKRVIVSTLVVLSMFLAFFRSLPSLSLQFGVICVQLLVAHSSLRSHTIMKIELETYAMHTKTHTTPKYGGMSKMFGIAKEKNEIGLDILNHKIDALNRFCPEMFGAVCIILPGDLNYLFYMICVIYCFLTQKNWIRPMHFEVVFNCDSIAFFSITHGHFVLDEQKIQFS